MWIKQLNIERYKSIQQPFQLRNAGKLHIFIGENNAGKTTILDAISQAFGETNKLLQDPRTKLEMLISLRGHPQGHELKVIQAGKKIQYLLDDKAISTKQGNTILQKHSIRLCATNPKSTQTLIADFDVFQNKYPDLFKIFASSLKKHIPQISITQNFFHSTKNSLSPYDKLGAGFRQVFTILMYLFNPLYTVLLLEEPEIHLHPALQKKLLYIFEHENIDNQIFMTTHSPIFIRPTNLHELFRVTRENDLTHIYSPRLTNAQLDYNRLTQELNAENCEMFFADTVLFVEGASDQLLMQGLIDRFYSGSKEIKVIQLYGKSNIDVYVELLNLFNIPYHVLLDRDALYDTGIKIIQNVVQGKFGESEDTLIRQLREYHVTILPNGSIEKNYPTRYQRRRKHKTQNALYAARHLSPGEYLSPTMKYLRKIIESL